RMTDIDTRVIHLIAQLVPVKEQDIKPAQRLRDDLGMDSVSSMELLSMLAEDFELDVGIEDVADVHTVAATIDLVKVFLAKKAA
ncbi:MAG: acyl carrier protein, partial [Myxococcales bacterium]|nr:acyl carrier protein [Myxococcales bacterium]